MFITRSLYASVLVLAGWFLTTSSAQAAGEGSVHQDAGSKTVTLTDGQGDLVLRLNYDHGCVLDQVSVRGRQVAAPSGVASGLRMAGQWFATRTNATDPKIAVGRDTLSVKDIAFGPPGHEVRETWQFTVKPDQILWRISRHYQSNTLAEDAPMPEWNFSNLSTWTGGLLNNGGVVWNKYLETPNATYGAHANTVTFWNRQLHDALRISASVAKGEHGAMRFSHQTNNTFSFAYVASREELKPKRGLSRFLSNRQDVWAPFTNGPGEISVEFALQALDYDAIGNRGTFRGVGGEPIRELLNTVARYGVIDTGLVGGNGWRSGYICLHEQWFAEMALALDDPNYTANLATALDRERDHAIGADGRVKARWGYNAGDAIRGTYDASGYYEAQWGYLLDSQPDYVICVAEQFDLTGDRTWLAGQKTACEKALNFLLRREVAGTGLVAVMTDSQTQHKGSDWIDIIWASYENALINAELYQALQSWSAAEETLGDPAQSAAYRAFAARLKASFNRPLAEGGFWDPTNQWYAYWREKDGSVHGDNLVTPVNFAAIGYGLCDDPARKKAILDRMEVEMQKENLFFWPLCFFPYQPGEGMSRNFPFPHYENGDIFLSWGELAVRSYAAYDPSLALKYVKKTLAHYEEDGLSFQRYLRQSQSGSGDDILAGNCMAIVGLYRDIYGIQPKPNRLYLEPHLTSELASTELAYPLRGQPYVIGLYNDVAAVAVGACALRAAPPFAVNATATGLQYFPGSNADWSLSVTSPTNQLLTIQIESWPENPDQPRRWTESAPNPKRKIRDEVAGLRPGAHYQLNINGRENGSWRADKAGHIAFSPSLSSAQPQQFELRLVKP